MARVTSHKPHGDAIPPEISLKDAQVKETLWSTNLPFYSQFLGKFMSAIGIVNSNDGQRVPAES